MKNKRRQSKITLKRSGDMVDESNLFYVKYNTRLATRELIVEKSKYNLISIKHVTKRTDLIPSAANIVIVEGDDIGQIRQDPNVISIEPVPVAIPDDISNDPLYRGVDEEWTGGDTASYQYPPGNQNDIRVGAHHEAALEDFGFGSYSPMIGQYEWSWAYDHPDMSNVITLNECDVYTDAAHSLAVASVMVSNSNNEMGMMGICPNCTLGFVSMFGVDGFIDFIEMLEMMIEAGVRVVNTSFSSGTGYAQIYQDAITDAYNYGQGTMIIASAGNETIDLNAGPRYPSCYDNVLSVTNPYRFNYDTTCPYTDMDEIPDPGTCTYIDVSAPNSVAAILPGLQNALIEFDLDGNYLGSSSGNAYYYGCGGTSCSAPVVTALAGVLLSHNQELTAHEIYEIITSTNVNNSEGYRPGMIDFHAALIYLYEHYPPEEGGTTIVYGCMDSSACNYNPDATEDDETCWYADIECWDGSVVCYESDCLPEEGVCSSTLVFSDHWNVFGIPIDINISMPGVLEYRDGSYGYVDGDLVPGRAYFTNVDVGYEEYHEGPCIDYPLTVELRAGWNTMSGANELMPVTDIEDPGGIITSDVGGLSIYGLSRPDPSGQQIYERATELIPGKGYWIRASANGEICLWNCFDQTRYGTGGGTTREFTRQRDVSPTPKPILPGDLGLPTVPSYSKPTSGMPFLEIPPVLHVPDMNDKRARPIFVKDRNGRGDPPPDPHWGDLITQTFTLNTGWNYISFYIIPEGDMLYVFDELIQMGILENVTAFYPPTGPVFWNPEDPLSTLDELRPGYGVMVRISDPPGPGSTYSFSVEGRPINTSMTIPLYQDWNMIGYFGEDGTSPEEIFADLIEAEKLVYVTTNDPEIGNAFFDPSGPDFMNTLNEMYIGVGYWVKVIVDPDQYPDGYIPFNYESTSCLADECIFVDPSGGEYYDSMGNPYPTFVTIQQAIDSSNNNLITDIIIKPGTYVESVGSIAKKNYNLKGEGEVIWLNESQNHFIVHQCSIGEYGDEDTIVFFSENISIDNITFISNPDVVYSEQPRTIEIQGPADYISITNCVIDQENLMNDNFPYKDIAAMCEAGESLIHMGNYSDATVAIGIRLTVSLLVPLQGEPPHEPFHKGGIRNVVIKDNVIRWCNFDGIGISPQGPLTGPEPAVADVVIQNNEIISNYFGFMNNYASMFTPSSASSNFLFIDNVFADNCVGFQSFLQYSEWSENEFDGNVLGGAFVSHPTPGYALPNTDMLDNIFTNHFIAHVYEHTVHWNLPENDPYLIDYNRNYWDDYTGEDQDGDGFGDTSYWVMTEGPERGFDPNPRMTEPENV